MKSSRTRILLFSFLAFLLAAVPMASAEEPVMNEEAQAMQQRFQDYATPTEKHQILKKLSGTWNTKVTYWMNPGEEPQTSNGTSVNTIIMNGLFLEQTFTGEAMGQPFEGRGFYGFDNIAGEYKSIWFDSMGSGMVMSTGQYDPAAKAIKEKGTMSCPITNGPKAYRGETIFNDDGTVTFNTYSDDDNGKEYQSMEIIYTPAG